MEGSRVEQPLCACYKECQEFQKVVELKDTGLVVYCHRTRTENIQPGELIATTTSASQDAFILHNTTDVKITPPDLKPALEKNNISCLRCRQIFENAQELLRKVKLIDRKNVMGVCEHCLKKSQSIKIPCYDCEEIAKKFISSRDKQKEDTKRSIKSWLSKMSDFLKDAVTPDKKVKTRAYSELQIDQLCQYSPKSRREPEVNQMFYPETCVLDTNLNTETVNINLTETLEKSVGFTQPEESTDTPFATYGGRIDPWIVESNVTFGEPHQEDNEPQRTSLKDHQHHRENKEQFSEYYDDSTKDVKESIKRRHDFSLRNIIRTEKTRSPFRSEIYEIPKIAPWEKDSVSKNSDTSEIEQIMHTKTKQDLSSKEMVSAKTSQKDLRESQQKKDYKRSSDNLDQSVVDVKGATKRKFDLNLNHMMGFERDTGETSEQHRVKKYSRGKLTKGAHDSEELPKKMKKKENLHLSDDELKYKHRLPKFSHETEKTGQHNMAKTKMTGEKSSASDKIPEYVIRKQFSYFFPKTLQKKELILGARSSQLIKNTQERLRRRAEEQKKRQEEERKYQLEEEGNKNVARDERKRFAEQKKKQQIYVEGKKKLLEVIQYTEKYSQNKMFSENERKQYISKDETPTKDKDKLDSMSEYETKDSGDSKKDLKRKSQLKYKDDHKMDWKGTQNLKSKIEPLHKIDESEKTKKGLKSKYEQSNEISEKSKREHRDKIDEVSGKPKRELESKPEQRDKIDDMTEQTKRDKSKSHDITEELSKKTKKDIDLKAEHKEQIDAVYGKSKTEKSKAEQGRDKRQEVSDKTKKELKPKSEQRDEISERNKKGLKSKPEPKEKRDDVIEKSKMAQPRDKFDEGHEKAPKDLKLKPDPKEKSEELTERPKRDSKSKSEARDKIDVSENAKKESKSKPEKRDTVNEVTEKGKKVLKSKPNPTDKFDNEAEKNNKTKEKSTDKEAEISQKEKSKEGRNDQLQRDQEDKERLAQVAQLRKDKEASLKKQDSAREPEEARKKKIESSEEKKAPSNKTKEFSKENVEPSKKGELGKKLQELSAGTEATLATKEWTSKELKEFSEKKKQQDMFKEKEEISERKQGLTKDVAEPPKKTYDSIKENERATKGKEKNILKKEESANVKEESKEMTGKVADALKKPKDGMDETQFRKLQAELAKQKEEDLKNKRLQVIEAQKIRDLAEKRAKEEGERKLKVVTKEAKAVIKPEPERPSERPTKEVEESVMKELKIHDIKIRNRSSDDLILRLVRIKQTATRQTIKPRPCDIDPEVLKAHKCHHKSGQTSSFCELCNDSELEIDVESYENKLNLKKELTQIIIGEKIFKHKPSHFEKTEEREVIPILFQSIFQEEPQEIVQIVPPKTETVRKQVLANLLELQDKVVSFPY